MTNQEEVNWKLNSFTIRRNYNDEYKGKAGFISNHEDNIEFHLPQTISQQILELCKDYLKEKAIEATKRISQSFDITSPQLQENNQND